jgi:hypothetical protein
MTMISKTLSITFVSALLVGAYAGCSDGAANPGGSMGNYHPAGSGTVNGDQGGSSSGTSSGGSSSGTSSGGTSSGTTSSSGGSTSSGGSSSGGSDAGAPVEAGPPPLSATQALAQVGSCMQLTAFTDRSKYGVSAADIARSTVVNEGGGNCMGCHNVGDNGFWASYGTQAGTDLTQQMFTETQQMPFILKWFAPTVDQNGQFKDIVASNAIVDQEAASQSCANPNGTGCHPKFQLNPNTVSAINDFVTNTLTMWHAGTCTGTGTAPADAGAD